MNAATFDKISRLHRKLHQAVSEMYSGYVSCGRDDVNVKFTIHARGEVHFQIVNVLLVDKVDEDKFLHDTMIGLHKVMLKPILKRVNHETESK